MKCFLLLLLSLAASATIAQRNPLAEKLDQILSTKNATVGISIMSQDGNDTLSINGHRRFPMQSVFKLHIGVYALSLVDHGKLSLDQKIPFNKNELRTDWWSPIAKKYPEGGALTLREFLEYTVGQSDNNGCELLLDLVGGPEVVGAYFTKHGFKDVEIVVSETDMHEEDEAQFLNWTTPREATRIFKTLYEQKLLSKSSTDVILNIMNGTITGKKRIPGELPEGTIVIHKTGTSGINNGVMAAVNDVGIIMLPDGKVLYLSVFVTESAENLQTNEQIIARVAKAAWDYYVSK